MNTQFFCYLLAFICFILAGVNVTSPRINFQNFGFAFLTLSLIIK